MYTKVLTKAKTIDQREKLKEEISMLMNSLYVKQPNSFENTLTGRVREEIAILVREELKESGLEKRDYLNGLLRMLSEMGIIKLTLGFEPTMVSIDKFWGKIVDALGRYVILDIDYQPKLLGGAFISYGGEYKDYSLRKLLDDEISKGARAILSVGLPKKVGKVAKPQKVPQAVVTK